MAETDIDGRRMETSIRISPSERIQKEGKGSESLPMTHGVSFYRRDRDKDQDNGPFTRDLEMETRFLDSLNFSPLDRLHHRWNLHLRTITIEVAIVQYTIQTNECTPVPKLP